MCVKEYYRLEYLMENRALEYVRHYKTQSNMTFEGIDKLAEELFAILKVSLEEKVPAVTDMPDDTAEELYMDFRDIIVDAVNWKSQYEEAPSCEEDSPPDAECYKNPESDYAASEDSAASQEAIFTLSEENAEECSSSQEEAEAPVEDSPSEECCESPEEICSPEDCCESEDSSCLAS